MSFFCLKPVRCSALRASLAACSCWTGRSATLWAHPTAPRPPPGAAPRCTHTPQHPSTPLGSPPPSPPPETDTRLQAEMAGRAPGFRRPWRPSAWAPWGGRGQAAVSWTWPLLLGVCTLLRPTPTHTCWAPTVRIWQAPRTTTLPPSTRALGPGSAPHTPPNSTIRCGYPLQVKIHWDVPFSFISFC